ncbi:MAG TPA: hypothetical protein VK629_02455 [Steroidobacteraceae bacterium]|nr:hypothetical protein [Steroidobacteraceae bacterium]
MSSPTLKVVAGWLIESLIASVVSKVLQGFSPIGPSSSVQLKQLSDSTANEAYFMKSMAILNKSVRAF